MKKILAFILTVCTVASLAALQFPVSAGAEDINDHLVVHYDFEGETLEERLSDKAPVGTPDNLEEWASNAKDNVGGKIVYENGTARCSASSKVRMAW